MKGLTEIQKNLCRFIRQYAADNGCAPTRVEIATHFGWKSANAAEVHIKALVKKGALYSKPRCSRALKVLVDV